MPNVKDVLTMRFVPLRPQTGLAVLRVVTGVTMFLRHGLEKQPANWAAYWVRFAQNGVDPIGIGPHATLIVTIISDFFCSILIVLGLGTRWAALWCFGNISVAWAFQLHFALIARTENGKSGEHILLYLGALVCLVLAGPGAASLDRLLAGRRTETPMIDMLTEQ